MGNGGDFEVGGGGSGQGGSGWLSSTHLGRPAAYAENLCSGHSRRGVAHVLGLLCYLASRPVTLLEQVVTVTVLA